MQRGHFHARAHVLSARLRRARISEEDVLEAARRAHGLERMDEIKFAIFEASGRISIIPKRNIVAGEDGSAPRGDQRTAITSRRNPD